VLSILLNVQGPLLDSYRLDAQVSWPCPQRWAIVPPSIQLYYIAGVMEGGYAHGY
jgi:hypothetical protein